MNAMREQETPFEDPRVQYFDELAPRWEEVGPDPAETIAKVERHRDLLQLSPGTDLLEVGCGTGQLTGWLASQVKPGRVIAVDFAPAMLNEARAKQLDADFRHLDVCADDVGIGLYDVILCFHAFPHFRDQPAAVQSFARALRPQGRLLIMHKAGSGQINAFHSQVGGAVRTDFLPSQSQFQAMMTTENLTIRQYIDREDLFFLNAQR